MVAQFPTNKNLASVNLLSALEALCKHGSFLKSVEAEYEVKKSAVFAMFNQENITKASTPFGAGQIVKGRDKVAVSGLGKDIKEQVEQILEAGGMIELTDSRGVVKNYALHGGDIVKEAGDPSFRVTPTVSAPNV